MSIFELAKELDLSVTTDNIAEIPIIILTPHLFISESERVGFFDLNDTRTMDWYIISAELLKNIVISPS